MYKEDLIIFINLLSSLGLANIINNWSKIMKEAVAVNNELTEDDIRLFVEKCPHDSNLLDFLKRKKVIKERVPDVVCNFLDLTEKLFVLPDGTTW